MCVCVYVGRMWVFMWGNDGRTRMWEMWMIVWMMCRRFNWWILHIFMGGGALVKCILCKLHSTEHVRNVRRSIIHERVFDYHVFEHQTLFYGVCVCLLNAVRKIHYVT